MKIHPLGMFRATYHIFITQVAKTPLPFFRITKIWSILPLFFHKPENPHFGQHMLTKIFIKKQSPEPDLNDPNFGFFISQILPEIFNFEPCFAEAEVFK